MKVGLLALLASLGLAICLPLAATAGEVDTDGDTVPDSTDNCPTIPNAGQADGDGDAVGDVCDNCSVRPSLTVGVNDCDVDTDGYGGPCDCDYNQSNFCDVVDFGVISGVFNSASSGVADQNCSGFVDVIDFGLFSGQFNGPQGPSGLSCAGTAGCSP